MFDKSIRIIIATAALAFASAATIAVLPSAAAAAVTITATCSGHGCDHKDPQASGCASSTTVADSASTAYGRVEMRWSPGCKTNWLRVPNLPSGVRVLVFDITERATQHFDVFHAGTAPGTHWGNMIYAPGCAFGTVVIDGTHGGISVDLESSDC